MPDQQTRALRRRLQRRSQLVKARTRAKNEVHAALMRQLIAKPKVSDLFGLEGRRWLVALELPVEERETLDSALRQIDFLDREIAEADRVIARDALGSAEIRSEPEPSRIAIQVAAEAIAVGRKCGFEVEPIYGIDTQRFVDAAAGRGTEALLAEMAAGAKQLAGGRPSMLQDVMRGRRTEIDYLNGYVVDQGRRVGVKTPFNEKVVELVHSHGVGTLKPDRKNLEPLARMLPR